MLNLLRADFYKLRRSKSFFICLGIIAIVVAYIIIDFSSSSHIKEQLSPSTFHWIYVLFKEKSFLPYFIPVLQAIFITILIVSEYNTDTILIMLVAILSTGITSIFVFDIYDSFSIYDLLAATCSSVFNLRFVIYSL